MVKKVTRKTLRIRESGRSSDFITPAFGFGCLFSCSYCTCRRHVPKGITIAQNTNEIIKAIDTHVNSLDWPKQSNQTHEKYWTYDFSCSEDYFLHLKYHNWEELFEYFTYSPRAFGTAATKTIPKIDFNPERKIRIRFSITPQIISSLLEPNTSLIIDRIKSVDKFIDKGFEVHLNWSPVVVFRGFMEDYKRLFDLCNQYIQYKDQVKSEVIFLTHNEKLHKYNVTNNIQGEHLLWVPELQEAKISQFGGKNVRYKRHLKAQYIEEFKQVFNTMMPWNTIRYIF